MYTYARGRHLPRPRFVSLTNHQKRYKSQQQSPVSNSSEQELRNRAPSVDDALTRRRAEGKTYLGKKRFSAVSLGGTRMADGAANAPSTDGIDYERAARWATSPLSDLLADDKGRQLFKFFLHQALAEENLSFYEAVEAMKTIEDPEERRKVCIDILELYVPYINISANAMQKIQRASESSNPNQDAFALANKEVYRLLDADQFPRFRRSEAYLNYLQELLPPSEAEKWRKSFSALLENLVGRFRFRQYLRGIHAEENLRFWEAVQDFKASQETPTALANLARQIQQQYLKDGSPNEVSVVLSTRKAIDAKLENPGGVDTKLFNPASKQVEQALRNDAYVRFLHSPFYTDLFENKE